MSTPRTVTVRLRKGQLLAIIDALRLTRYYEYMTGRAALKRCEEALAQLEKRTI